MYAIPGILATMNDEWKGRSCPQRNPHPGKKPYFGGMTRLPTLLILKTLVLAALLALILGNADLGRVGAHLGRIPPAAWALALLALLASTALQALRWKLLLKDPSASYRECYAFIGVGASLAMVSPSSLLADGAVGYWLGKRQAGVLRALSTLLAARVIGAAAGVHLLFGALPSHLWVFRELRLEGTSRQLLAAGAAVLVVALLVVLAGLNRRKVSEIVDRTMPILKDPRDLGIALGLSFAVQLVQMAAHWIAYRAIGAPIAFADLLFFLPLITLLGMLPISLGGIGVREGMGIVFFTLLPGVGREAVLAEAAFRYLLMAGLAVLNLAVAGAVLGRPPVKGIAR